MTSHIRRSPQYRHVMHRLEDARRTRPGSEEYWLAREIGPILGYDTWAKFVPVIDRARIAIETNGWDASHHIARTSKMVMLGNGAKRRVEEFFLSRGACYLIAMNGDSSKPAIAAAMTYFAVQTRNSELRAHNPNDIKRLEARDRLTNALKRVGKVAKDVGVTRYALFHDARHRGLYGMSAKEVAKHKKLREGESILDRAAALELSAHAFQSHLAAEKIVNEGISGEDNAIRANFDVAQHVRNVVISQAGKTPEDLDVEPDSIKDVKRRIREVKKLPPS